MKTVILIRHAKSSHEHAGMSDVERPLNGRGEREAPRMARRLAERGGAFDLLISSPANRARSTAGIFAEMLGASPSDSRIDDRLYSGMTSDILCVVHDLGPAMDRVLLFGHNPNVTEFVNAFQNVEILNVPTCGVVELSFNVESWSEVRPGEAVRMRFNYPKEDERA